MFLPHHPLLLILLLLHRLRTFVIYQTAVAVLKVTTHVALCSNSLLDDWYEANYFTLRFSHVEGLLILFANLSLDPHRFIATKRATEVRRTRRWLL